MHLDFPLRIDGKGRTARTTHEDHVRDLIEQVLFTAPGERVNRPDFGAGLNQLVFAPNSVDVAGATELLVHASLQQWVGDLISVEAVEVAAIEGTMQIRIQYVLRGTTTRLVSTFAKGPGL